MQLGLRRYPQDMAEGFYFSVNTHFLGIKIFIFVA
jgi:hypothetical protein